MNDKVVGKDDSIERYKMILRSIQDLDGVNDRLQLLYNRICNQKSDESIIDDDLTSNSLLFLVDNGSEIIDSKLHNMISIIDDIEGILFK